MSTSTSLDQKVVRTSPALVVLGIIFALFLAALGTQMLVNIAELIPEPNRDQLDASTLRPLEAQRDALLNAPNPRTAQVQRAERDLEEQERILTTAESSWRTWLETRATLGKADHEDQELRTRRNRLDALRSDRDAAERALSDLKAQPDPRDVKLADLETRLQTAQREANSAYHVAMATWTWKVLALRLGLVVPVWALALVLWNRRQQNRYITLVWGYWGFSTWMLLYGIIPYLPQYGGYVPLTLGAGTTVWVSVSMVRHFNQQAQQRRRRIVDRALNRHQCPGCDRDYLIGCATGLDTSLVRKATMSHYDTEALQPRCCPACGLALFGPCHACGHVQTVHQDYCTACRTEWHTGEPVPARDFSTRPPA